MESIESGKAFQKHLMSPRIVLEAIDEYLERNNGFFHNEEEQVQWKETWTEATGGTQLPNHQTVYSESLPAPYRLRTLWFIDTERERAIGIGENYKLEPIPPAVCLCKDGHLVNGESVIFGFRYDYQALATQYNEVAKEKGWQ
jgi:hypothetical protein